VYRLIFLIKRIIVIETSLSSSSVPFTPCGAEGIHEELPSVAISSYPP
jgi:hypothetical protein